jgi:hypothetical protein
VAGLSNADTLENKRNYLDWLRFNRLDNGIAVGVNAFTVLLMCWLAWAILMPKGEFPAGWKIAVVQAQFFENAMGATGRIIFLLVAAAFLSDSWLGITDAVSRMHSDFFYHFFPRAQRLSFRAWYYIFVVILTLISATTVLMAAPGALLLAGGVLNFIAMAIYMPALMYLNYKVVPAQFPDWVRPARATFWIASLITAFYVGLGIIYLLFKFVGVRLLF